MEFDSLQDDPSVGVGSVGEAGALGAAMNAMSNLTSLVGTPADSVPTDSEAKNTGTDNAKEEVGQFWEMNQGKEPDGDGAGEDGHQPAVVDGSKTDERKATAEVSTNNNVVKTESNERGGSGHSSSFVATNLAISGKDAKEKESTGRWKTGRLLNMVFGKQGDQDTKPPGTTESVPLKPSSHTNRKTDTSGKPVRFTYLNFIDKLRKPEAKPQARKLNHFVKQYMAQQVIGPTEMKRIHRFVSETYQEVSKNVLWRNASELELDNVFESLEKCILLKLFTKIFFAQSVEQKADRELQKLMHCHQFLKPENLDIKEIYHDRPVWELAQSELKKMDQFKAPRDKIVCLLNCCKMILNLLKKVNEKAAGGDAMSPESLRKQHGLLPSADDFLPLLIYMVIKAKVPHLHLNIRYIEIARHPKKLSGEAAYYFTNLKSAVAFIERLSPEVLSIDPAYYERELSNAKLKWEETEKAKTPPKVEKKNFANSPLVADPPQDKPSDSESKAKLTVSQFKFYGTRSDDLKVGDIPKLLEEYKRMANLLVKLQATGRTIPASITGPRTSLFGSLFQP